MEGALLFRDNKVPLFGRLSGGMPLAIRPPRTAEKLTVVIRPAPSHCGNDWRTVSIISLGEFDTVRAGV